MGGAGTAADLFNSAIALEGDYVPAPQVVGVVTLIGVSCSLPEVLEVACCPFGFVLVIAWDGLGALLEAPPRRPVAFLKVRLRALGVGLIAQSENRPVDTSDQLSGSLVALGVAIGDVARGDDQLPGGGRFRFAAHGQEEDCEEGGRDEPRRGPPLRGSDASDQLPVIHGDKVSEGAPGWLGF